MFKNFHNSLNSLDHSLSIQFTTASYTYFLNSNFQDTSFWSQDRPPTVGMGNRMVIRPTTSRDLKSQVVTPIRLKPNISKTTGDAIFSNNR